MSKHFHKNDQFDQKYKINNFFLIFSLDRSSVENKF